MAPATYYQALKQACKIEPDVETRGMCISEWSLKDLLTIFLCSPCVNSDEAECAFHHASPKAIFFLILVRHVPHKNEDKYHVSRVWARIKHGDDAQQPLATWTERS